MSLCLSTSRPKVFISRYLPYVIDKLKTYDNIDVQYYERDDRRIPRQELLHRVQGCDGIYCLLSETIDQELLESAGKKLKVVSTMSVGFNHIDVKQCQLHHVKIGHTPGVLDISTAETAVALTFSVSRKLVENVDLARQGKWGVWRPFENCGRDVSNSIVGVIGLGRIGSTYARMMKAFNCEILYCGNRPNPQVANPLNAKFCSLETLLEKSDIVSIHCPLNDQTKHLINAITLNRMKSSSILINTSRGSVVDHDALYDALKNGVISGAGLDVTDPEPLHSDHKLYTLSNCTIFPHIGSATLSTRKAMADIAIENLIAGIFEKPLPHGVSE